MGDNCPAFYALPADDPAIKTPFKPCTVNKHMELPSINLRIASMIEGYSIMRWVLSVINLATSESGDYPVHWTRFLCSIIAMPFWCLEDGMGTRKMSGKLRKDSSRKTAILRTLRPEREPLFWRFPLMFTSGICQSAPPELSDSFLPRHPYWKPGRTGRP